MSNKQNGQLAYIMLADGEPGGNKAAGCGLIGGGSGILAVAIVFGFLFIAAALDGGGDDYRDQSRHINHENNTYIWKFLSDNVVNVASNNDVASDNSIGSDNGNTDNSSIDNSATDNSVIVQETTTIGAFTTGNGSNVYYCPPRDWFRKSAEEQQSWWDSLTSDPATAQTQYYSGSSTCTVDSIQ